MSSPHPPSNFEFETEQIENGQLMLGYVDRIESVCTTFNTN